jgi:hypothetical protein
MNWKGFGRNRLWPDRNTIPAFALRDSARQSSAMKADAQTKDRSERFLDTKLSFCRFTNLFNMNYFKIHYSKNYSKYGGETSIQFVPQIIDNNGHRISLCHGHA